MPKNPERPKYKVAINLSPLYNLSMKSNAPLTHFMSTQFGLINDSDMKAQLLKACRVVTLKKHHILFMEGAKGNHLYFLHEGMIKLYKTSEEGKEVVIHFVSPGELFAEIILKPGTAYPVTSVALEDCILVSLNVSILYKLMEADTDFMKNFTALLAWRLKNLVNTIHEMNTLDIKTRFYNYLLQISRTKNSKTFKLPVAKKELALLMGTTPETLSRIIKKLGEEKLACFNGQTVSFPEN